MEKVQHIIATFGPTGEPELRFVSPGDPELAEYLSDDCPCCQALAAGDEAAAIAAMTPMPRAGGSQTRSRAQRRAARRRERQARKKNR